MTALDETLARLRARGEGCFMPFLVLGDPDRARSFALARALLESGADVLELGFPFSDPPADGPVIQAADQRALAAGTTPAACFDMLAELRKETSVPFALLVYYNLILRFGVDRFYARCREVGVDAVLVADLPVEESSAALAAAARAGVAPIFIASELTTERRLAAIAAVAKSYLYVVAHLGVTGARERVDPALASTLARLRRRTDLPLLAGFGISTPDHVRAVLDAGADGAIVGSAIIAEAAKHLADLDRLSSAAKTLARSLKEATRRSR